ncbi:MAG: ATP-binding cassette domain-containing protein [Methylohalobius sp. ZOD2]
MSRGTLSAVRLEGVCKSFSGPAGPIRALNHICADLRAGQITGLIGPDGAGKTTLIRTIAGLLAPDTGQISVLGQNLVQDALPAQRQLGYMPQRFGLYGELSVQENLNLYADLQGLPAAERPDRFGELLTITGLAPFTDRLARRLSGGMKQKLGLSCVLVGNPRLLLLDEPTVGVDPLSRRDLWRIIYRQVEEKGVTVILSTAYLDEAERCQEVLLMHQGELIDQGSPRRYVQAMVGRSWQATVPKEMSKRAFVQQMADLSDVVDAVILGDNVHVVTRTETPPEPPPSKTAETRPVFQAVPPRLEDYFIAVLAERTDRRPAAVDLGRARVKRGKEAVITVNNLKRRFGPFYAVDGIDFEVYRGEVFGLLGANGAGKTTTFRMLCGLLPVSEGEAKVAGVDLRKAPARVRARLGYMAQHFSLYGHLSVDENLYFFSGVYGLRGREQRQRIRWALTALELEPFRQQPAAHLALGYQQRLALACALLHSPEILFLDEPTSGTDPLARREFWQRINNLAEQGVTVLVTTHFMEEAEYTDRLLIMQAGKVLAAGTPRDIRRHGRTRDTPEPTLEDTFIRLIEANA